ncbi:hypothetical protein Y032_0051g2117 [Ancylostoma ceylanicum]|uniref:Uncharacterized protein n=1 Tax=Ancylostoma ceylanicum TaxID=53326 RepID=A0A016U7X7_9BILA|nr:hypothetical protein Y032_0051g2117 [Ancylostoma ceylanicum]
MMYAASRTHALALLNKADTRVLEGHVSDLMNQINQTMGKLAFEFCSTATQKCSARRPELSRSGRLQALTPIRHLHKRSYLRKQEKRTGK